MNTRGDWSEYTSQLNALRAASVPSLTHRFAPSLPLSLRPCSLAVGFTIGYGTLTKP